VEACVRFPQANTSYHRSHIVFLDSHKPALANTASFRATTKATKPFPRFHTDHHHNKGSLFFDFETLLLWLWFGVGCANPKRESARPESLPQILTFPQRKNQNREGFRFVLSQKASTVRQQRYNSWRRRLSVPQGRV